MKSDKGKNIAIIVGILALVLLVVAFVYSANRRQEQEALKDEVVETVMSPSHPLNATYKINNQDVTLGDGRHEEQIPDSSSTIVTSVWGEPVSEDVEGSTQNFWAVTLNQELGGGGSFYYIAACVGGGQACVGTNAILLGDRVAMQSIQIQTDGTIVVNYTDRVEEAPMTESPSVDVTRKFTVIGESLKEVLSN